MTATQVLLPNGTTAEVDTFDYNLVIAALQADRVLGTPGKSDPYTQLMNGVWIRADKLEVIR